jgi:hypothetical protein
MTWCACVLTLLVSFFSHGVPLSEANLTPSPGSGNVPLSVSFSTAYQDTEVRNSKTVIVDFGDGTNSGLIQSGASIQHTYSIPGNYTATMSGCNPHVDLACVDITLATATIRALDSTPAQIISLSPGAATFGQWITVNGKGIVRRDAEIIIDGKFRLLSETQPHDGSLMVLLSASIADKDARCPQSKDHSVTTCMLASYPLKEGLHALSVRTPNNTSNELKLTVKPYLGQARIDRDSLVTSERQPEIRGSAKLVKEIAVSITGDHPARDPVLAAVKDGRWFMKYPILLPPGRYPLRIRAADPGTGMDLGGGTLSVLAPEKVSTKFNLRDSVKAAAGTKVFATPSPSAQVVKVIGESEPPTISIDDDVPVAVGEKVYWKIQSGWIGWVEESKLQLISTAAANAAAANRMLNPSQECIEATKKFLAGKITPQESQKACGK